MKYHIPTIYLRLLWISITFTLLMACAPKQKDPRAHHDVDPEFAPYYQMYEDWYGVTIYDIPINFDEIDQIYAGVCRSWSGGYHEILIDAEYWSYSSERERISLVFHELGHCHQRREHTAGTLVDGCPNSIMDEYTIDPWCLDQHWDYYIEELSPN